MNCQFARIAPPPRIYRITAQRFIGPLLASLDCSGDRLIAHRSIDDERARRSKNSEVGVPAKVLGILPSSSFGDGSCSSIQQHIMQQSKQDASLGQKGGKFERRERKGEKKRESFTEIPSFLERFSLHVGSH
jgi:hypothetical protein